MAETIVVIDDAAEVRRVVEVSLQRAGGFEVFCADGGETGFALVRAQRPHLVLLDVMMPHVTGPQLFARLHDDPELRHIRVVYMSAVCGPEQIAELTATGALGVIAKPFRPMQLIAQVREFLQKDKTHA